MKNIIKTIIFVDFVKKNIKSDKVRDHCHLTDKYRGPSQYVYNINVKQKDSNFIPFAFHNFSNYDCHLFFKRLVDLKKDKVKFRIFLKPMKNILQLNMVVLDLLIVIVSYQRIWIN